jgi:hypothetical protein
METETASTPAGEAATAELSKIMSDTTHPHHDGYRRGDQKALDYVRDVYRKAYGTKQVELGEGLRVTTGAADPEPGETPEEADARERNEVILAPLKQEWADDFDRRFASARQGARTLFAERAEVLDDLGGLIRKQYGPKGETLALKFLADLEAINEP